MKIIINSLILALINIASVLIGFYVFFLLKTSNQIAIQLPVACFFSVMFFLAWKFITWRYWKKLDLGKNVNYIKVFFLSILFSAFIFTPLHYLTQGYLTSIKNILGLWGFQIPTNILALMIYARFSKLLSYADKTV